MLWPSHHCCIQRHRVLRVHHNQVGDNCRLVDQQRRRWQQLQQQRQKERKTKAKKKHKNKHLQYQSACLYSIGQSIRSRSYISSTQTKISSTQTFYKNGSVLLYLLQCWAPNTKNNHKQQQQSVGQIKIYRVVFKDNKKQQQQHCVFHLCARIQLKWKVKVF